MKISQNENELEKLADNQRLLIDVLGLELFLKLGGKENIEAAIDTLNEEMDLAA